MTTLTIHLPDHIAKEARDAGLLTSDALTQLLQEAMRHQAGNKLLSIAKRIQASHIPPMSEEAIVAEVKAVREERRARQAKMSHASSS